MKRVNLAARWDDEDTPETICGGRLYRGAVHLLAGAPDVGKTTLGLSWVLGVVMDGGTALIVDEEGGTRIVRGKLKALGASREQAERIIYCPFPGRGADQWERGARADLEDIFREHQPRLVLIDSAARVLAAAGLNENDASDVNRLWDGLTAMARGRCRPAVVVIDHLSKASDREADRYSRGSSAKLAASDVMYRLEAVKPFSRAQDGVLKLSVTKDRMGCLERHWRVRVRTGAMLAFEDENGEAEQAGAGRQMPPAQAKLLEALGGTPRTVRELTDRIAAEHGHGLYRTTVSRELSKLAKTGLAERHDRGVGREARWARSGPDSFPPPADPEAATAEPVLDPCSTRAQHRDVPVLPPLRGSTGTSTPPTTSPVLSTGPDPGQTCQGCEKRPGSPSLAAKPDADAPAEFTLCSECVTKLRRVGWTVDDGSHRDVGEIAGGEGDGTGEAAAGLP